MSINKYLHYKYKLFIILVEKVMENVLIKFRRFTAVLCIAVIYEKSASKNIWLKNIA